MAARVQVVVEAKDEASGILRGITSQFSQFGSVIEEVTGTSVNWGNVLAQVSGLVIEGLKASVQATQEYANEVRDLALISGTSAEEASRLIQVLGDYELTAQDATVASRALTRNGLAPTVETIAQLSDEYLSLNTAQERNQFLLDNFGRAGAEWVNLLNQGGDAILELNDSVAQNLILTEQNIQQAEEYRLALDAWDDSVQELQISIGTALLPALTAFTNDLSGNNLVRIEANRLIQEGIANNREEAVALASATIAANNAATAQEGLAEATEDANIAARNSPGDVNKQINVLKQLTQATQEQINATAYMLLQQELAADGVISDDEYQILISAGEALEIFDENAGNAFETIGVLNDALADGTITAEAYALSLDLIPDYIEVNVHTVYTSEGTPPPTTDINPDLSSNVSFAPQGEYAPPSDSKSAKVIEDSGGTVNNFYAPVTLQVDASVLMDVLDYR